MLLCLAGSLILSGCSGKVTTDEDHSPTLIDAEIDSYNEGSLSEQYVSVELAFDQPVRISDKRQDSLRITIAQERVSEDDYTLTQGEDDTKVELLIPVEAVTTGVLEIEKSEKAEAISDLTDETGQYAVNDFTLEGMIPSGITLSTISSTGTNVTKRVETALNIRSIAWVAVTRDGEVIPATGTSAEEELDGYVAFHGHEFLDEDPYSIAGRLTELLEQSYDQNEFAFSDSGNLITLTVLNEDEADYDIQIYDYLKINGIEMPMHHAEAAAADGDADDDTAEDADADSEDGEGSGSVVKEPEIDREPTAEEQAFISRLHIAQIPDEEFPDGSELYTTITITGEAMPEEEIYSVSGLEQLIELSFENEAMNELALPSEVTANGGACYGMDLIRFLSLCGVDTDADSLYMTLETGNGTAETVDLAALIKAESPVALVFADDAQPLSDDGTTGLQGPVACVCGDAAYGNVSRIILGETEEPVDPEYHFHNREPWSEDLDKTFTVEVWQDGAEYLGALNTKTYTTADLEQLMRDYPEHVVRNYYGTIGNKETYASMGTGNWLDYFEGVDLYWLLTEEMGLENVSGRAELYNRDLEQYSEIDDLAAYFAVEDASDYYILTPDGVCIPGTVPMISCCKNGYPILPEHVHDVDGYVRYNHMNDQLEERGISTEVGVVKNHNGPFVACLGNLDGVYGGNQVETDGDCVLFRIYLD